MPQLLESTRRTLRGALQNVGAFAALIIMFAIPPVGDALNAVLGMLPFVTFEVTPGLVTAIAAVGIALAALVTKIQNVFEARDYQPTVEEYAVQAQELAALVKMLANSLDVTRKAVVVSKTPTGDLVAGPASPFETGLRINPTNVTAAVIPAAGV